MPFCIVPDKGTSFKYDPVPVAETLGISDNLVRFQPRQVALFLMRQAQLHHRIHIGLDPVPKGYWSKSKAWINR